MTWFSEKILFSLFRCIFSFMCSLHKKYWTVSNAHPLLYQENINAKNLIYSYILADSSAIYLVRSYEILLQTLNFVWNILPYILQKDEQSTHCPKMKTNDEKPSKFQFHFPGLLLMDRTERFCFFGEKGWLFILIQLCYNVSWLISH